MLRPAILPACGAGGPVWRIAAGSNIDQPRGASMSFILKFSIRARVIAAFALVLLVTCVLGGLAAMWLGEINRGAAEIGDNWLPATRDLGRLTSASERFRAVQAVELTARTADEQSDVAMRSRRTLADRDAAWTNYERTITSGEERR